MKFKKKTKYGSRILKYSFVFSLLSPGFLLILPYITTCRKKYVFLQVISKVKGEKMDAKFFISKLQRPFPGKKYFKGEKVT